MALGVLGTYSEVKVGPLVVSLHLLSICIALLCHQVVNFSVQHMNWKCGLHCLMIIKAFG